MTHQERMNGSSLRRSTNTHSLSELLTHLESAISESDVAISTLVDSFLTVATASNVLAQSRTCSPSDREVSHLIQKEVSVIISSLQFQDLLKQRLEFIKSGLESLTVAGVGANLELGSHLSSEVKQAFVNHDDGEVTLFLEAA